MSFSMPRVFISSTSEFASERELLKQQIESLPDFRLNAYTYEAEAAGAAAPEARLRDVLESSEIFVLILGDKFGSEYPGQATSIVEWEYEYAKSNRKELKGYVKYPPNPNADPRQAAFIARAGAFRSGSWMRKFTQGPQLIGEVIADLKTWVTDAGMLWISGRHERTRWKDRMVLGSCVAVALGTIAAVVAGTFMEIELGKLAVVFGCGVTMFGGLFLLLKSDVL
jgi:Domain of unknown function (DUF4062)